MYKAEFVEGAVGGGAQMDGENSEGGTIENDKNEIKTGFHSSVCKQKSINIIQLYSYQRGILFYSSGSLRCVPTIRLSSSSIISEFRVAISIYFAPSPSFSAAISQRLSPSATT